MDKFVPESVLEKLVVGARVRYIPNYECKSPSLASSASHRYGAIGDEGYFDAENKTGIIQSTSNTNFPGHPYQVKMDMPYRFGNQEFTHIILAADELVLVEDEA